MAFPVNGGTYNVILNVVSKKYAALAACLTMLSYVTTAVGHFPFIWLLLTNQSSAHVQVISSSSAIHYLYSYGGEPDDSVLVVSTIGLLTLCALLNLWGITESATVSCFLFGFHVLTMAILIVASLWMVRIAHPVQTLSSFLSLCYASSLKHSRLSAVTTYLTYRQSSTCQSSISNGIGSMH